MKKFLQRLVLVCGLAGSVQAADRYTETFSTNGAAPASSLSLGAGSWSFTGGVALAKFANSLPLSIPDIATLRPSNGAFTGDYVAAGVGVLGFKFRSAVALPSSVYVELKSGTAVFQRVIPVTSVGTWESFMISLSSLEEGGWTVLEGRAADFQAALHEVTSLEIKVQRSGATAREYALDDLYVDGLPQATGRTLTEGRNLTMAWDALQLGALYTMQQSPSLSGPWKDADTVTATSRLQQFTIPADDSAPQGFFRLRGP